MKYLDTNIPIRLFQNHLNSEIYVDKSKMIAQVSKNISTGNRYLCITRPRRFGKTVNANMLGAFYTKGYDTHHQFDGLAVAQTDNYEKHLNQYHVIYIDFSRMPDFLQQLSRIYSKYCTRAERRFARSLSRASELCL